MKTKQQIIDAINDLFGDTSVPAETTLEQLEDIQSEVREKISALKQDMGL